MKRLFVGVLIVVLCISLSGITVLAGGVSGIAAGAAEVAKGVAETAASIVKGDNITVKVLNVNDASGKVIKSKTISFPDAKPVIIDGRTMIPIRAVAEAVGYNVSWDGKKQEVLLTGYFGRTSSCNYQGKNQAHSLMTRYKEKNLYFEENKHASVSYSDDFNGFVKMALDGRLLYMEDYVEVKSNIRLILNDPEADCALLVNNHGLFGTYKMNVPAMIIDDRTYLPLRAVGEMMGLDVSWDGDKRLVTLTALSAK